MAHRAPLVYDLPSSRSVELKLCRFDRTIDHLTPVALVNILATNPFTNHPSPPRRRLRQHSGNTPQFHPPLLFRTLIIGVCHGI